MGRTGTGPHGISNSSVRRGERDVTCSQHSSNQGVGYQPEMATVPKDAIYAAIEALSLAIGYMPQIKTEVPQWQATLDQDLIKMQCAILELRKLGADLSR